MIHAARAFGAFFLLLGLAILVRTATLGGGQVGWLAGAVFVVLGLVRLRAAGVGAPWAGRRRRR